MTSESKSVISRVNDRVDYEPPERFPAAASLLHTLRHLRPQVLTDGYKLLLVDVGRDENVYAQALRLLRLAEYLLMLPDDYEEFSMGLYSLNHGYRGRKPVKCGTTACALGHAPYAVGSPRRRLGADTLEGWEGYSIRVFGDLSADAYRFFYAGSWESCDNTPHGAAARILWMMENAVLLCLTDNSREVSQTELSKLYWKCDRDRALKRYQHLKVRGGYCVDQMVTLATRLQPDPALYEGVL